MVELVVALGLLGSVWLAVFGLMRFVLLGMGLTVDRLEVQQNARVAVEKVAEELRWAGEVVADVACGASGLCTDRVTARIPPNNPRRPGETYDVTFRRDAVQRELERRVGGGTSNLAGLVEELQFRYADAAGAAAASADAVVRIEMTMTVSPSSGVTAGSRTLTTAVLLRNRPIPSWPLASLMGSPTVRRAHHARWWEGSPPVPLKPAGCSPTTPLIGVSSRRPLHRSLAFPRHSECTLRAGST